MRPDVRGESLLDERTEVKQMFHAKHRKTNDSTPRTAPPWLVRARAIVQLATAIVTLVGAVVALLARLGLPWVR